MTRINQSWREQAKPVTATSETSHMEFKSVWDASVKISELFGSKRETVKKEIKKSIRTGCQRYGFNWRFKG